MHRFNKTISRVNATVLVVLLSLIIPALSQANISDQSSTISIKNFGRINDHYYRGAQPKGQDYADLAKLGVHTVINLTNGDGDSNEKAMAENAGMKYYQIPMTTHVVPTPDQLAAFLRIANDPAAQPVYVHCVGGKHRTGVMTAVYRMTQNGWTADEAFNEMKQFKFGADFLHSEFKKFVFDYYTGIVPALKASQQAMAATPAN